MTLPIIVGSHFIRTTRFEKVANDGLCRCSVSSLLIDGLVHYASFFSGACDLYPSLAVPTFSPLQAQSGSRRANLTM